MRKELRPSHDLIACDLCQRTILKGERIEAFVGGGERQRVCELCSFRALRAGWVREAELEHAAPLAERTGPRRSLWSRAVQWAEDQGLWGPPAADPRAGGSHAATAPEPERQRRHDPAPQAAAEAHAGGLPAQAAPPEGSSAWARGPSRAANPAGLKELISGRRGEPRQVQAVPTSRYGKIELAFELFNASEHRRTIAGVGRALGEPWVSAAPIGDGPNAHEVGIVVAWELSWYRFRVDLDDADQPVLLLDRGDEVDDLDTELRGWNAAADADGRLNLAVEAVS